MKTAVFSKVIPKKTVDVLAHTTCESVFEAQVCQAFIERLKTLNREKKYPKFHQPLHGMFGEQLQSQTFLDWLAKKLDIRPSKFSIYIQRWRENNFEESRGQNKLPIKAQLAVYNTWLENSIVSTDGRNGRNEINISKRQYLQRYGEIRSDLIELTEKKTKGAR